MHGAVENLNTAYRAAGVPLPDTVRLPELDAQSLKRAIIVAPPSVQGSAWLKRVPQASDAFASGWMQLRGTRRRRGVDRGFVLSDHADWPGLNEAIRATGASRVFVTHGYTSVFRRWLETQGFDAGIVETAWEGESFEAAEPERVIE